jgi:hypothetical protein
VALIGAPVIHTGNNPRIASVCNRTVSAVRGRKDASRSHEISLVATTFEKVQQKVQKPRTRRRGLCQAWRWSYRTGWWYASCRAAGALNPGCCTLASAFPGSGFNGHALRLWKVEDVAAVTVHLAQSAIALSGAVRE